MAETLDLGDVAQIIHLFLSKLSLDRRLEPLTQDQIKNIHRRKS
jgi:hypothetical protein